jgi:hypothetical protein
MAAKPATSFKWVIGKSRIVEFKHHEFSTLMLKTLPVKINAVCRQDCRVSKDSRMGSPGDYEIVR